MPIVAPSILAANWSNLANEVAAVEAGGADWLHLDVMDGQFVPPITFGPKFVEATKSCSHIPLDVHLMIVQPERQIQSFIDAGADSITIHSEAVADLAPVLEQIKKAGIKTGVALNPGSDLAPVVNLLDKIDILLLMTVNPGWGGQPFIESVLNKIAQASKLIAQASTNTQIEVDGGINSQTAKACVAHGARILVAGSSVFQSPSYATAITELRG